MENKPEEHPIVEIIVDRLTRHMQRQTQAIERALGEVRDMLLKRVHEVEATVDLIARELACRAKDARE